ncbi:UNVERIFIED_CONTAM: hypothetical protein PYX00_003283 [Menopon gallinae]
MKNEMKSGRRIANIVNQMMDADRKKEYYERLTSNLLEWIREKVAELEDRNFPNSLEGIQKELLRFKQYRTVEKPPKYKERSEIEALYFHINTLLMSLNQPVFQPSEGKLVQELQRAWEGLETAEHSREVALREELLRQEKLEQLHYKFVRKSVLREGYVKEMIHVLSDPRYGNSMAQVDATVKKHEAISADILARKERYNDLSAMSAELRNEKYHGADKVQQREEEILKKWRDLLDLLEKHKNSLNMQSNLMATLREIDTLMATIQDLQVQFESEGVGTHLIAVEDLLQKHALQELQVTAVGETLGKLQRHGHQFITAKHRDAPILQERLNLLDKAYDNLVQSSEERRSRLEDARNLFQFLQDHEEEESWLIERQRICTAAVAAKDLRAVLSLQQKHKTLQDEMKVRRIKSDQLCEAGQQLIADKHPRSKEISSRIESLQKEWKLLHERADLRKKQLEDAAEAYQFYTDANEAESWLKEKMALVASTDYGVDEPSAQALLARHKDLRGEIKAYKGDIDGLNAHAQKLKESGVASLELSSELEVPQEVQEEWTTETRLVPQEVWEDETFERIENRVVVENRFFPQVRGLYPFSGQGMEMQKNEIMLLLQKNNQDWWNVRKENGTEGFVPANYVKEIEGKMIPVTVQKPEKVKDTRKVKKTKMVRQTVRVKKPLPPKSPLRSNKKKVVEDNQNVEKRQKNINDTYGQLLELAEKRHLLLEDAIRLYGFYRECDDFEKWIKDKEKMLKSDDSNDSVETARRKYEKFLTDLSASAKRIESLDHAVDEFVSQGHLHLDKVKARQRQIHDLWNHLNRLKTEKEKSLEGASSVELFNRTCDEAKDWMSEKMMQLDGAEHGPDLKTVQALQRRHRHLERELAPVEEKVNRVKLLANSVQSSYPHERANVNARQREIQELWEKVKNKAKEKRSRLEDAVGQQVFMNSSKNLLNWAENVKEALNADESVRDIATAEELQKKHSELNDDIKAHEDEWKEVVTLGKKLLNRNPQLEEVKERLGKLANEHDSLREGWDAKENWLKQCLNLQVFNREADRIDASTSAHEAVLEFSDLGNSLDEVKALEKRHLDLEKTLAAQDEKLTTFSEFADSLINKQHYDSKYIDNRRNQVLDRRRAVKDSADARRYALTAANNFQEFAAKVDDLRGWIADKTKIASDESYRDLSNLERKLQKHEAFERELRANEGQLRAINKTGQSVISENCRSDDINRMLKNLNSEWENLVKMSRDKGRRLRQAAAQHTYNRTMDDARLKLEEIRQALQSKHVGSDLRNCKDLMKKHQALEMDMATWEGKIADLAAVGEDMAHEGHFDADNILKASRDCQKKFEELKEPARKRRAMLEESLRFHKFGFELDAELQWVREHKPLATSDLIGQNLHQAQSLHKKHKKLEAEIEGHQPMIDKTQATGQQLLEQKHPKAKDIEALCQELDNEWEDLQNCAKERAKKLELSLKAQQFFFEAGEVESWLTEKNDVLSSTDYGRDRDAASKLLAKHKALELELDSYNGIVTEMGHVAEKMVNAQHPDAKGISAKQQLLSQQMKQLQKLASIRQHRLMESMYRHEYFIESSELDQWIREQMQTATSEEYGQDYEHLLLLQSKFDDWKRRMEAGSERFNQCEELARKLITNESPYAADIEKRQEQLRKSWQKLLEQMSNREQRLNAAGEIHRFHRDVADALSRIQEKDAALSDDLGRDLNSVTALIKRHEGFVNDLVALEAQLQVLVEDAARLQAQYPGQNAAQIAQQQQLVLDHWNALQQRAEARRDMLAEACHLHKFLSQARDLMSWSSGLRANMMTEEKVRDAASAQTLKAEHEAVKAEIEAREDIFRKIVDLSKEMTQDEHYAAAEINEKLEALLEERQRLHSAWQHKKVHLDQLIDLHFFLRDAKQIHTTSSTQEAALNNDDFGTSVDEVASQVKKHDAFEKLVATQEERVSALQEHGAKLIQQNHFETSTIKQHLADVVARRMKVAQLCQLRRQKLDDSLLYAQFVRDVAEAESWIGEKQKRLHADANQGEESASLEDKIKKLQKHQAFQAELSANQPRITHIKSQRDKLLAKKHASSREIQNQWEDLLNKWKQLLQDADNYGRGLEEAQDILEFNNQVEKIESWIRDKEMMVQAGEIGKDYEHCLALQRKLDDVDSDMRVDDARIKSIYTLADKLIRQGRSDTQSVKNVRDKLSSKWQALQGALGSYRERLSGALEVHGFNRDLDDTTSRVAEKAVAMSSNDTGRDLPAVEQLKRRQETLERDMTAIEGKIKEHNGTAHVLIKRYPEMSQSISDKLYTLQDQWKRLQDLTARRRDALQVAYTRHKFLSDLKEVENWIGDAISRMKNKELPTTIPEAEAAIHLHEERKAEIDGRQKKLKDLKDFGSKLISDGDDDLKVNLERIEQLGKELDDACEQRRKTLQQAQQLALFREQADQAEMWLSNKEAFLNNDDLGDYKLSSVEALIQKHEAFEKTIAAQSGKIEDLKKFANEIIKDKHYDQAGIESRLKLVTSRRERLMESSDARKRKLLETKKLLQFLRNVVEVQTWLHGKIQIANDESYRDPSNLQSKIQKHAAFEAELQANQGRIAGVIEEGNELMKEDHFASEEIETQVAELETHWNNLLKSSKMKRVKLDDAYQAQIFLRSLEELEMWMNEVEGILSSEDHGRDLTSVAHLLKRHALLENDVLAHGEDVKVLKENAAQFDREDHFMKDEIQDRFAAAIKRYHSLQEPMQIRKENLEDSHLLHQFIRDADEELEWLEDKQPIATSEDLGNSLTAVQNLQKKHQALEAELVSRGPVISALSSRAQQMSRNNHFAAPEVERKMFEVHKNFERIKDLASVRKLRLLDAVESQMFYAEASDAAAWLKEKKPVLISPYLGKDEDSVSALSKKLEGVQRDLASFENTIQKLRKLSNGLIDRGHFDSANIKLKQFELESAYSELLDLAKTREFRLAESKKYFKFLREADEVAEWVNDQTALAASEDYGSDVEHVELLIKKFDAFIASLNAAEARINKCIESGNDLIKEKNPESAKIKEKIKETQQLWDDIKELAHARQEALAGAKQVHMFDRTADETIEWIGEKDAALTIEGFGQDLETIQAQVRKHEGFETELEAVKKQVESVKSEANRLANIFPDTREHIEVKQDEVCESWCSLLEKAAQKRNQLVQAEQLQSYFDQHRDLMAWLNEMIAKITAPDLAQDVAGAETLIARHTEHYAEIDSRSDEIAKFYADGAKLVNQGHFLSDDVEEKIRMLKDRHKLLLDTWTKRKEIYDHNLDTQIFKRDADILENWMTTREIILRDGQLGDSIPQVEDLLRKHDDFEKTISAQEEKFKALQRITLLEKSFEKQREAEMAARQAEKERIEKEKIEARKRKEVQRITDERRREDERRRHQEGRPSGMNGNAVTVNSLQVPDSPNLQKAGSLSQLIGDRMKREMKRAESMKVETKKPRRTPSFTTRRRTQSFRKLQKLDQMGELPPVEIHGLLDRKQELQSGGKKAPVRSWKTFYTVLCGQLLCFFKDQEDFINSKAASSPVSILKAKCEKAQDYTKRKHVFRLCCTDGSEYLFLANTEEEMSDWVNKITFHAGLPPSLQLLSYDESQKQNDDRLSSTTAGENSSGSSRGSTPEPVSPAKPVQTQTQFLAQHRPPIPPRTAPPPVPPPSIPSARPKSAEVLDIRDGSGHNGSNENVRHFVDMSPTEAQPPPLPVSQPPRDFQYIPHHGSLPHKQSPGIIYNHNTLPRSDYVDSSPWQVDNNSYYNQGYGNVSAGKPQGRPVSMPPVSPTDSNRRTSESSSESEHQIPSRTATKERRQGVLSNLFGRRRKGNNY